LQTTKTTRHYHRGAGGETRRGYGERATAKAQQETSEGRLIEKKSRGSQKKIAKNRKGKRGRTRGGPKEAAKRWGLTRKRKRIKEEKQVSGEKKPNGH